MSCGESAECDQAADVIVLIIIIIRAQDCFQQERAKGACEHCKCTASTLEMHCKCSGQSSGQVRAAATQWRQVKAKRSSANAMGRTQWRVCIILPIINNQPQP